MIGKVFSSEKQTFTDTATNTQITRLTSSANNFHFYFTDNSFMKGDREILFLSDRGAAREHVYNFFKMDLATGGMVCLSDESDIIPNRYTKTPEGDFIVYITGREIKKLDVQSGSTKVLYRYDSDTDINSVSISCDRQYIIFLENEKADIPIGLPNYGGFMDRMFQNKKCRVMLLGLDGGRAETVFEDTHYLSHVQFSPTVPYMATFCHEGPWNLVHQRIWLLNLMTRRITPCARQGKDDCVGHEFWTQDGLIFFENRREGHDGTITEHKTQAFAAEPAGDALPYIGFCNLKGEVISTLDMPVYCNHYHANADNTLLVGDAAEHIMLIDISGKEAKSRELSVHGTSWRTQSAHCHPTFGWDGEKILYASDAGGKLNIYLIEGPF